MDELRKRNYLKTYEAAAEVWHSEAASVKEQTYAWRIQRSLLLACAGNDPVKQFTVLKKHYEKLEERMGLSQAQCLSQVESMCATSGSTCENGIDGLATKRKLSDEISEHVQHKKGKDVTKTIEQPNPSQSAFGKEVYNESSTSKALEIVDNNSDNAEEKQNKMNEPFNNFFTARQMLDAKNLKNPSNALSSRGSIKPSQQVTPMERQSTLGARLGMTRNPQNTRRDVRAGFISPVQKEKSDSNRKLTPSPPEKSSGSDLEMANIDPAMVELITNQIMRKDTQIDWNDIAGLDNAKTFIREAAVLPLLRPDIFTGIRKPPRGILLFGPPGTGKTLIGKCIASQSGSTFFSISASTLTSKWVGEGEKMVRALFAVAAMHKPSVIFIDEIDSLLSKRNETEHESSRRLKTEFLVQFDGTNTTHEDRTLVVGATNRPQELDDAARRRFVRRLYIPLPENAARLQIMQKLLASTSHSISTTEMDEIVKLTAGYSGADIDSLCHEAAMQPIRSIPLSQMLTLPANEVRPINIDDFRLALRSVRSSVAQDDLNQYLEWNRQYGSL